MKDKLREHVHFWREEKAPESVIDVIEKGYVLPLLLGSTVVSPYVGMGRKQNGGYNASISVQTLIFHLRW